MGINATILDKILDNNWGWEYSFDLTSFEDFMLTACAFPERQEKSIRIIEDIMVLHGKQELLRHVVHLARVELGIRELEPWVRDHVVHALLSFVLGITINEHLLRPSGQNVDSFQWKLAGLFHDVGYPAQVAKDIIVPFTNQINSIKRSLGVSRPDVFFQIVPVGLDILANEFNSLDIIQHWLNRWRLQIDARREYREMIDSGGVCHGMISALSVLYVIDMMYQKYNPDRTYQNIYEPLGINWNQQYFEDHVAPACAAIFVHNLPPRCFQNAKIDRRYAALPFLLRLSDCLQDWERPSAIDPRGKSDEMFNIEFPLGNIAVTVTDPDRRRKIAQEISNTLVATDIIIQ